MITAYRICQRRLARSAFDGEGARLHGGRWNSPGTRVVYLAGSIALAQLEMLVHLESDEVLHGRYVVIPVSLPLDRVVALERSKWPRRWRASAPYAATRSVGDAWAATRRSLSLKVPSVLVPEESNYLLNPVHPAFSTLRIGRPRVLAFDRRLA